MLKTLPGESPAKLPGSKPAPKPPKTGPTAAPIPWQAPATAPSPVTPYKNPYSIDADPGYQLALSNQQSGLSDLNALLTSERSRAAVGFGDSSLAQSLGLDQAAVAAAKANYQSGNSTLSRLDHANELGRQTIINTLAAHGLINSGDLGYREGEQNRAYGNATYDARQALLDQLNQYQQSYLSGKQSLQQQVTQALMAAYQNQLSYAQQNATGYTSAQQTAQPAPGAPAYTGDGSTQSAFDYLGSLPKQSYWW